jgi:rhamnosyltransferase
MTPRVAAVVVTYHPDPLATADLLTALAPQVNLLVVVDNGSPPEALARLENEVRTLGPGREVLALGANTGIAAAQNRGIAWARKRGAELVLLSDQDSVPAPDMVVRLVEGLQRATAAGGVPVAAVGPVTVDERAEGTTLLFESRRWGPRRAPVPDEEGTLVPVAFLIASGCLVTMAALEDVGPMNEAWFIDHIDLEWGLRARQAGYALYGVAGAYLGHHLGDRMARIPGRAREVHIHSPARNYYMARNTVLLMRSGLLPTPWWWGYLAWITKYSVFYVLAVPPRAQRLRLLARGLLDGVRGRTGRLGEAGSREDAGA